MADKLSFSVNAVDAVSASVNSVGLTCLVGLSPMSAPTRLASLSYSRKESMPVTLRNKEINMLKLDLKLYFWTRLEIETMIIWMWTMCMG